MDKKTPEEIAVLLCVLRMYDVSDFKQDDFGLHIKFENRPRMAAAGLMRPLTTLADLSGLPKTATPYAPPPESDDAVVKPVPYDLDDLLPSGGQ